MKNILFFLSIFISSFSFSQTSHMVLVGGSGDIFTPSTLTVNVGDTVNFHNIGGYHNVNGTQATYPSNPASFEGPAIGVPWSSNWWMSVVFTLPGTYDYQCDPHVPMGMFGQIIVQSQTTDCNGVVNGTSLLDDCGVCQQAYLYNYILHTVTFLNDTAGVVPAWNQILVMPNDPMNPYWNASCLDCNSVPNGVSMIDSCGVCQPSLVYNYVTHVATPITDTSGYVFGPTEMLVLANNPMNPNWNSSCTDCNGIINGTSLMDS